MPPSRSCATPASRSPARTAGPGRSSAPRARTRWSIAAPSWSPRAWRRAGSPATPRRPRSRSAGTRGADFDEFSLRELAVDTRFQVVVTPSGEARVSENHLLVLTIRDLATGEPLSSNRLDFSGAGARELPGRPGVHLLRRPAADPAVAGGAPSAGVGWPVASVAVLEELEIRWTCVSIDNYRTIPVIAFFGQGALGGFHNGKAALRGAGVRVRAGSMRGRAGVAVPQSQSAARR